jgi:hypothetical protein
MCGTNQTPDSIRVTRSITGYEQLFVDIIFPTVDWQGVRMSRISSALSGVSRAFMIVIATALIAQVGLFSDAGAVTHSSVTWNFTSVRVNTGTPVAATLSFSGLPGGAKVIFERQFGTKKVMRAVERLSVSGTGSQNVTLPQVPMGSYSYQVVATRANGKLILRTAMRRLFSYGTVPLSVLCNVPKSTFNNGCGAGTVQVGSNLFQYEMTGNSNGYRPPQYGTDVIFPASGCRSITLTFALSSTNAQVNEIAYIQIIQTTLDPAMGSTPVGTVGTLTATLDGGPFYIENASTNGDGVYYNGSAICWSV